MRTGKLLDEILTREQMNHVWKIHENRKNKDQELKDLKEYFASIAVELAKKEVDDRYLAYAVWATFNGII